MDNGHAQMFNDPAVLEQVNQIRKNICLRALQMCRSEDRRAKISKL